MQIRVRPKERLSDFHSNGSRHCFRYTKDYFNTFRLFCYIKFPKKQHQSLQLSNFESPAINNLDCIMTSEVFEKKLCNGWLVMWVHDWPFVQGTGVQISLETNFFFLIWIIIFKWKLFFTSLWYSKPILYSTPFSNFSCLLGNILNLNFKAFSHLFL